MIIWPSLFPSPNCRRASRYYCEDARRVQRKPSSALQTLYMDLLEQRVERAGEYIQLQPREYKLLEFLMRNAGQVVTRAMLLEHVWGYHFDPQTNVIDVHISRLRQKIDKDFDNTLLETIRGAGYRLGPVRAPDDNEE